MRAHHVRAGVVEDLVAALEPGEVVEDQVGGLQHRAHGPVGDHHPPGEGVGEGGVERARLRRTRVVRLHGVLLGCHGIHVSALGEASFTSGPAPVRWTDDRTHAGPRCAQRAAPPRRPGADRRVRRVERRGRGGQHRAGAPRAELGRHPAGLDRPRGVLRLPGHPPARAAGRRGHPEDRVADHPAVGGRAARHRPARRAGQRHRAEPALARRSARSCSATSSDSG